jgi:hypothetical protein
MNTRIIVSAALGLTVSAAALAHGEDVDVLLRDVDGQLVTGSWSHDTDEVVSLNERVFAFEWGEGAEGPNIADEPGFFAQAGTLAGLSWGVDFVDAVRVWDGTDFDAVSPDTVTYEFLGAEQTTPTTAGGVTEGFAIPVGSGGFDDHYEIVLNAPTDGSVSGVYLISMRAFAEGAGAPGESETFWFVGNFGADELDHEAAIEYVEDVIVPAPGAGALLALGGVALTRRRRA